MRYTHHMPRVYAKWHIKRLSNQRRVRRSGACTNHARGRDAYYGWHREPKIHVPGSLGARLTTLERNYDGSC